MVKSDIKSKKRKWNYFPISREHHLITFKYHKWQITLTILCFWLASFLFWKIWRHTQHNTPLTTQPSLHHVHSSPSHYVTKPICTQLLSESVRCKSDYNLVYTVSNLSRLTLKPTVVTIVTFLTKVSRDAIVLALYIQSLSAKMARDHHPRFPLPRRYLLLPLWVNLLHRHQKRPAVKSRLLLRLTKPEHKIQNLHALASNK